MVGYQELTGTLPFRNVRTPRKRSFCFFSRQRGENRHIEVDQVRESGSKIYGKESHTKKESCDLICMPMVLFIKPTFFPVIHSQSQNDLYSIRRWSQ
jgi:hypothetical protein